MKKLNFEASPLWRDINKELITEESIRNLDNFKSDKINHRLAMWNPQTNGLRYLKVLIYNLCSLLAPEDWKKMAKIKNRDFGNPIAVTYNNQLVDLDYIQSLLEMNFISRAINLRGKEILEIGGGYGRTCHAIISNHDVTSYYMVDLENCLRLSRAYLKKVLTKKQFSKITFLSNEEMGEIQNHRFDLAINIDSFAEMDPRVALNYLAYIDAHCKYFYVKNPAGKYRDKSLDNHSRGRRAVSNAMKTGLLRQVIDDIHSNRSVGAAASKFVAAYRPGGGWKLAGNSWARPWSYYWQAIYKRS